MSPDAPKDPPRDSPAGSERHSGDSLLETIGRRTGRTPKISLHGDGGGDATPIVDPRVGGYQDQLRGEDRGKYQVLGEIARGGMGVVLRGHDRELGRDVAMKVVHSELSDREEVIERFVEEAQIGGQLQHPGIVPVYELGLMADQRPYFTMKLIKGRTLAKMLARRKTVEEDRVRYLAIFESVCQTMAYAHSKGVIHRDLKPANVMVGGFGEVQVVDWGLSKVLGGGGVADELAARREAQTIINTVRSGPGSGSGSMVGNVLGTPEYMAPEQAQGEVDKLDERTDVFALGAILCELLTGAPPYVAKDSGKLVQMAASAQLGDARARIDAAAAPEELKELCRSCLMPAQQARPGGAEDVAHVVHEHIAGLESAAHVAQLEAAEDRLRAERSRRRSQLALAALAVLVLAAGGWYYLDGQRRERFEELSASFTAVQDEALQHQRDGNFARSVEVARGGLRLVEAGEASAELRERAEKLVASTERGLSLEAERLARLERERALFDFLLDVEMRQVSTGFELTDEELDAQYAEAFGAYGLDLEAEDTGERLMAARDTDLGIRLALGFDGWSRLLRRMDSDRDYDIQLLTGLGIDLDSNPLRTEVRLALVERDGEQLLALAEGLDVANAAPETLALLAASLREFDHFQQSRSLFVRGANQYPANFLLNYGAGNALYRAEKRGSSQGYAGALGYLKAALALRPDLTGLHVLLVDYYLTRGNCVMATRHMDTALEAAPDHSWNEWVLAQAYRSAGRYEEAIHWYERDIEVGGNNPFSESAIFACQVALGRAAFEDYVDWAAQARDSKKWFPELGPVIALCNPGWAGIEPDPERARAMLETYLPEGLPEVWYWGSLSNAYLLTGDGPAYEAALERQKEYISGDEDHADAPDEIGSLLHEALLARLEGDDSTADSKLNHARWLRDELIAGMEEEWAQADLVPNFDYLEKLAAR